MKKLLFIIYILTNICYTQVLGTGDGVRIAFYNVAEKISGDYFIQTDNSLQIPYIGSISTLHRDFKDVKAEMFRKFDSLYKDPELSIEPLFKINIMGEVKNPGYYYITGYEKLAGVFAMAGGETSDADIEGTYLIRDNKEIELNSKGAITNNGTLGEFGLQSADRIYVPRRWWVGARNTAVIISGAAVLVTIVSLLVKK